jgi:hypothetical protein
MMRERETVGQGEEFLRDSRTPCLAALIVDSLAAARYETQDNWK